MLWLETRGRAHACSISGPWHSPLGMLSPAAALAVWALGTHRFRALVCPISTAGCHNLQQRGGTW